MPSISPIPPSSDRRDSRPLLPTFGDVIDFSEVFAVMRRYLWAIVAVAAATFITVVSLTLLSHMQFVSTARLYLGELTESRGGGEFLLSGGAEGDVSSEMEILRSRTLITDAILESGLNVTITPAGASSVRYYQWLMSRRDPRLLDRAHRRVTVVRALATGKGEQEFSVVFEENDHYQLLQKGKSLGRGKLNTELKLPEVRLTLIPGPEGPPKKSERFSLSVQPMELVVQNALQRLKVSAPNTPGAREPVKVVTLSFKDKSPRQAARFLEHLMDVYLTQRQSWKTEHATVAEAFVTEQLDKLQESLDDVEKELADYRSDNQGVVLDDEAQAMIARLSQVEEQRVNARLQVASLSEVRSHLERPGATVESYMMGEAADKVLEGLAQSLSEARGSLANLETRYHEAAPEVREQRAQVDALLASIKNYVGGRLKRARGNLTTLNSIASQFEDKLKSVPGAEIGLGRLARRSEVYSDIHTYLLERKQQAAIVKASNVSRNRILDPPQVPSRESSPRLSLRLASGPFGLLLGVLAVLAFRVFGSHFQGESDVRRAIGDVPVFAHIPRRTRALENGRGPAPIGVPNTAEPSPAFVEAFRALRTHLYQSEQSTAAHSSKGKLILVSSPNAQDGKTTCVLGLASLLAADQKRVLVVDANVRKPVYSKLLAKGESTLLPGTQVPSWLDARLAIPTSAGVFNVLFSTEPAPPEELSSQNMRQFLEQMSADYDYILLDSAPYPLVTDALVLSEAADVCLSVLRLRNSKRRLAVQHLQGLSSAHNSPTVGVIINDSEQAGLTGTASLLGGKHPPTPDANADASEGSLARRQLKRITA